MFTYRRLLLGMLCAVLLAESALAGGFISQIVSIQAPEDFIGEVCEVLPDGTMLACGRTGSSMEQRPALLEIHPDGTVADITPTSDTYEGMYRDIIRVDEDSAIMIRSVPNDPEYRFCIGRIDAGEITWNTDPIANVFSIDRVDDDFLMVCKPKPVTAKIRRVNSDGEEIWKLRFKERMIIEGILVGNGMHIAYGYVYEDPQPENRDQRFSSLIFAFDDNGKLLWRHDGDELGYSTDLIGAVWADDCSVIAISRDAAYKFDANGEVWQKEFDRFANEAIVDLRDGRCMVICSGHYETGMPLRFTAGNGLEWKEAYLPEIALGDADPFWAGDDLYLVLHSGIKGVQQLAKLDLTQLAA